MRSLGTGIVWAVVVVLVVAFAGAAGATSTWGLDDGVSKFLLSPTTQPGYTSYASIDSAVTAGIGAGRTVMEFQGTWSGINETVGLRNNNLTFQGVAGGTTMGWASGVNAFGNRDNADFTATIKYLKVTTDQRGVTWLSTTSGSNGTLTVENSTINAGLDAIRLSDNIGGMSWWPIGGSVTVRNSLIQSSAGSGILVRHNEGGLGKAYVYDSRIEAAQNGVKVYPGNVGGGNENVVVERAEILCTSANPAAGTTGVSSQRFLMNPGGLNIADTLIAGFDRGVLACTSSAGWAAYNGGFLTNNTIVGNKTVGVLAESRTDGLALTVTMVNNIIAGSLTGVKAGGYSYLASIYIKGDKNAFFGNTTDTVADTAGYFQDVGRLTEAGALAGYTVVSTFVDPLNPVLASRNYRLVAGATALLDAGEQFQTAVFPSGTQTWLDMNNNNAYNANVDYVIDLGGYGGSTAGHRLLLLDAGFAVATWRFTKGRVDIGAYELSEAPVPEPAALGFVLAGSGFVGLLRRRRG